MAYHVKRNDTVEVISGDHKGARGKVLRIDRDNQRVVVEGVNMVYRHVRPTKRNPQGGRIQKEAPIHISNVLPVDTKIGRGSRVHFETEYGDSGKVMRKVRIARSGTTLDTLRQVVSSA
ncbi:MAG: 50S ribosomal protein L24 [Phycisphaerae bacterium]|nr:50S ribosomal protein L24 [Phycisphaerae bacterium]